MAIIGGAGNPVGGSFTGPAQALEIAGDRCFGFSGEITINNSTVSQFEFTTGNYLAVILYQFGYDSTSMTGSDRMGYTIHLNDSKIYELLPLIKVDYAVVSIDPVELVIPAYTEVKIEATTTEGADIGTWGVISGRIYRTRD